MGVAEVAKLSVEISADDRKLNAGLSKMDRRISAFGAKVKTIGKGIGVGLGVGAAAGVVILGRAIQAGVESLRELETVTTQTNAVLASTKGVSGQTAESVRTLAERLEGLNATIDDKVIQSAENLLLTFTNIRGDVFEPATQAVLDFSTATGTDATSAAKLLGRALNDPTKGMTALRRAGLSLDPVTEKRIKKMQEEGDLAGAQKILLDELSKRYGGSFARAGETAAGKQAKLADAIEDVQKALAEKLMPIIVKVTDRITQYLAKPETLAFFERLGETIAGLASDQNLDALASGMETAAKAVGGAISLFNQLPPEVKALAIGAFAINKVTGGAVGGAAEAFGKLLGAGLKQIFAANVNVIGANVTGVGGAASGAAGAAGSAAAGGTSAAGAAGLLAPGFGTALATIAAPIVAFQIVPRLWNEIMGVKPGGNGELDPIKTSHGGTIDGPVAGMVRFFTPALGKLDAIKANTKTGADVGAKGARDLDRGVNRLAADTKAEGIATQRALAAIRAKEGESLIAFRAGERATQNVGTKLGQANGILGGIKAKKTTFTIRNGFSVVNQISIRDVNSANTYKTKVAKTTQLQAS